MLCVVIEVLELLFFLFARVLRANHLLGTLVGRFLWRLELGHLERALVVLDSYVGAG